MELRRNPARRAGLVGLAALLVLGASACSGGTGLVGTPPAATVGDTHITSAQVDAMVKGGKAQLEAQIQQVRSQYADDPTTLAQVEEQVIEARKMFGRSEYAYSTDAGARALTELIVSSAYEEALASVGGKVTDDDRSQAKSSLSQAGYDDAKAIVKDTYLRSGAAKIALQRKAPKRLRDQLAAAADSYEVQLQQAYQQQKSSFDQVCFFVIQAQDEASANAALDRIRGGEDAATVAGDVSGQGGPATASCDTPSALSQALGQDVPTEKGSIVGPIALSGSYAAVVVDSTKTATYEEARASLAQNIPDQFTAAAQADVNTWIDDLVASKVTISVDPRFGTWDAKAFQVVPPRVPGATTTTSTTQPVAAGS